VPSWRWSAEPRSWPGFVDIQAYAGEDGSELAVARFESADAIARWQDEPAHVATRERGHSEFFDSYDITIATQWKHYDWSRGQQVPGCGSR
jgi:heme-degrading monooxygenase HmoA